LPVSIVIIGLGEEFNIGVRVWRGIEQVNLSILVPVIFLLYLAKTLT
jgi:hypothetical protein